PRPLAPDAGQGPRVGDRVRPAPAVLFGHRHAEQTVLARRRADPAIEGAVEVAPLLDRRDRAAEPLDVLFEFATLRRVHRLLDPVVVRRRDVRDGFDWVPRAAPG